MSFAADFFNLFFVRFHHVEIITMKYLIQGRRDDVKLVVFLIVGRLSTQKFRWVRTCTEMTNICAIRAMFNTLLGVLVCVCVPKSSQCEQFL